MPTRRVGVIGTFVWDIIYGRDRHERGPQVPPVEEWGGITYALGAFDAALPDDWEVVPLIRVGSDLIGRARTYLRTLRRVAPDAELIEVPYANNRVELRYESAERRSEILSGGIPSWSWLGLKPLLKNLDALYVNFISGWELDLETMQLLRQHYTGPIYCDLHSMLLALQPNGLRTPQPLPDVTPWCRCVDLLQVNEDEMSLMAPDPMALAATALHAGVRCLVVTLGSRGAVYFAAHDFDHLRDPTVTSIGAVISREKSGTSSYGPIRTALMPAARSPEVTVNLGDPTGCGDVWGATYFARLLAGDNLATAMNTALIAAARNVSHRGASGLAHYLRGEISPT